MLGVSVKETQKVLNRTDKRLHKSTIHLQRKKILMKNGHHYTIDDIDTKTLIAPKRCQMMNLNKYMFRTTRKMLKGQQQFRMLQEVINVMSVTTKRYIGHFKQHTKSIQEGVCYSFDQCD